MTHVFISYASADRAKAELLANTLTSKGVSVWWDRTIPPGRIFDEVIQEALNAAGCVIVVWSHASIASNWVKTEAAEAAARGILLPAVIENVALPIEFKRIQAANLIGWNGERDHPGLDALLGAAARLMQGGTAPHGIVSVASDDSADGHKNAAPFSTSSTAPKRRRSLKLAIGAVAVSLTLAAMIYGYLQPEHAGPEEAATAPVSRGGERRDDAAPAAVRENAAPREAAAPAAPSGKHGDDAALTPVREAVPPPENTPVVGTVTLLPVAPGASSNQERINLFDQENGGQVLIAPDEEWARTIDGMEHGVNLVGEGIYAFKDEKQAIIDTFTVLIPSTLDRQMREFELFVANDAPTGNFESIGRFTTQNIRLFKTPYQVFEFKPVRARYIKVKPRSAHDGSTDESYVYEFQLFGVLLDK